MGFSGREPARMPGTGTTNMRGTLIAIGLILVVGTLARADYGAGPSSSYDVDIQEGNPNVFNLLSTNVLGSGAYAIAAHRYDEVLEFNLSGTITGLTLDGELTGLRHISRGGDETNPTYASMGVPASFNMSVAVIPAPPSFDATGLGTTIVGSSAYVGAAVVDDGIAGPGLTAVGPTFSVSLDAAAIAAANQAVEDGDPFYLVLSGGGYSSLGDNLEGDLSPVTLDVQAASVPFFALAAVPEPSTLALLLGGLSAVGVCGRLKARSRRGGSNGSPRGAPPPRP